MNSNEFIAEEQLWDDNPQLDARITEIQEKYDMNTELVTKALEIRRDCKPYINENPSGAYFTPLFRGISPNGHFTLTKRVRLDDREPTDMPPELHDQLNVYFKNAYGKEFRNAMFVTGSDNEASGYGEVYIIFPIGEYSYLWSPTVSDLWVSYDGFRRMPGEQLAEKYYAFVEQVVKKAEWLTTELPRAIVLEHEIMFRCKAYHGIQFDPMESPKKWRGVQEIIRL